MTKTYFEARKWASFTLKNNSEFNTLADVDFIMTHLFDMTQVQLLIKNQTKMIEADWKKFQNVINEIAGGMPPQYAIGRADFYGMQLKVNNQVLIPRVETEELIDWVLEATSEIDEKPLKVLDIGTGSGAIAIAIKQNRPAFKVTATDISDAALQVAKENAKEEETDISFVLSDVFDQISDKYDIIISNPPYISEAELEDMGASVVSHEPSLALFAADNGLAVYKQIIAGLNQHLTDIGMVFFEIGFHQEADVMKLLKSEFSNSQVTSRHDVAGNQRMVKLVR
ncbi:peptide chain release factor N(5)-glutamine methyltransferase [Lentilactobacillus kosonis]|uniref:Release factor glutamine methyltransferase n=1 Tax=Lentilactobacillus kosonis TaxID=2810561 RepID=A0A401FNA0_9LACO|nr:peptide chain release factor N(5)-glutamine methyltransferase [Lentilactobacillus kosonis]GAY73817.1 protein-N(5)-glutamine methyltransferase PrmC, methylates polypeptide chain release factors RF1 and RF2 [Lentilactobacillus kosonis]